MNAVSDAANSGFISVSTSATSAMSSAVSSTTSTAAAMIHHSAFYKFVPLSHPDRVVADLRALAMRFDLLGSILVATEGINGMVAGREENVDAFQSALLSDAHFAAMLFKRSACKTPPFRRLKVYKKPEIVPLGIDGVDARNTGIDVSPAEWRKLIAEEDVVLLDNRNSFEFRRGRFKNAIDPQVSNFRDFPNYVKEHAAAWKAQGKRVAMYCTGGIRCEKTSSWMRDLDMEVFQLRGGILNYFKEMPDADKDWDGECFVFDNRVALDTRLQETSTTVEDVYNGEPDGEWRLRRAKELDKPALENPTDEESEKDASAGPQGNPHSKPQASLEREH